MAKAKRKPNKKTQRERSVYLLPPSHLKALANPLRLEALAVLAERRASPKEIAQELGAKLPSVSYHVKVLERYSLIEQVDKIPRRGAVEHFYRALNAKVLPPGLAKPLIVDDAGAEEIERLRCDFAESLLKVQSEASKRLGRKKALD
ncbi:MAG TPA: winged helix-turn-helix domain-containing protein [Solirubrobacterales bacterium]|nr:winged helix-turn-helix domain-containing protein [Solirubrobacterales bacterium]